MSLLRRILFRARTILRPVGWILSSAAILYLISPPAPPDRETKEKAETMRRPFLKLEERMESLQEKARSLEGERRGEFDRRRFYFDRHSAGTRALIWRMEHSGAIDWEFPQMVYRDAAVRAEELFLAAGNLVVESGDWN